MNEPSTSKKRIKHTNVSFPAFDNDAPFMAQAEKGTTGRKDATDVKVGKGSWEGRPYDGRAFNFKNDDPEHMQPQLRQRAHVKIFDTSKEADLKGYEVIMQQVCMGNSKISAEEREYDKDSKHWRIFLRWMDMYYTEPDHLKETAHVARKTRG